VGTTDPLLPETRRLAAAWRRRGVTCVDRYYPGEMHAFHALVWRAPARQCWAEQFAFADEHLGRAPGGRTT
jgi:acetyl esterase